MVRSVRWTALRALAVAAALATGPAATARAEGTAPADGAAERLAAELVRAPDRVIARAADLIRGWG